MAGCVACTSRSGLAVGILLLPRVVGHEGHAGESIMLKRIFNLRIWSLFIKEFHQIRRNRRLVIMLIIPPTLNIILFGIALNPNFENLRLGVADYSQTPESRDLISDFTGGLVFRIDGYYT